MPADLPAPVTRRQMLAMGIAVPVAGAMVSLSRSDARPAGAPAIVTSLGDALPHEVDAAFFGVRSDGASDDTRALRAAIAAVSAAGERAGRQAVLRLARRHRTVTSDEIVVGPRVFLHLDGGSIEAHLAGGDPAGLVPASQATIAHGAITIWSTGNPGIQAGAHAPIRVGARYGAGSPAHPDPLDEATDWVLRDLILLSDRSIVSDAYPHGLGAPGIQIYGGARRGTIEDIVIPDSDRMRGGIMADWAPLGPLSSLDTDMAANRAAYAAGRALTRHPGNTTIRRVSIGALTSIVPPAGPENGGSFGIRLSGVQRFSVSEVAIVAVTAAAVAITAGDLGYEFAGDRVRGEQMRGIAVDGVTVARPLIGNADGGGNAGYLMTIDGDADNLRRAVTRHGYRPMGDVAVRADLRIDRVTGSGSGSPLAQDGIRVRELAGARFTRLTVGGFRRGMIVDEGCRDIDVADSLFFDNGHHGLEINAPQDFPERISIYRNVFRGNGRAGLAAGLFVGNCRDCRYWSNVFGTPGGYDPAQAWGERVDGSVVNLRVPYPNIHRSTRRDGVASSILDDAHSLTAAVSDYAGGEFPDPAHIHLKAGGNAAFVRRYGR